MSTIANIERIAPGALVYDPTEYEQHREIIPVVPLNLQKKKSFKKIPRIHDLLKFGSEVLVLVRT